MEHLAWPGDDEWGFGTLEDIEAWDDHFDHPDPDSPPPVPARPPYITADDFRIRRPPQIPLFGTRDFRQTAAAAQASHAPPPAPAAQRPPRPIPPPSHSEDWLDEPAPDRPQDHYGYNLPAHLYRARVRGSVSRSLTPEDDHSEGEDDESAHFVTLEDASESESEDSEADIMPPTTRNHGRASVVDLTQDSSPPGTANGTSHGTAPRQPRTHKRAAEASTSQGRAPKRGRFDFGGDIEEVDLSIENPSAEEELLQAQQQEAIKAQQAADEHGPQRIGKRQCIICMENYTNCTVTSCGHFYCHECLTQALIAGEKANDRGSGNCPVCRKPLSRSTNKKRHDIIPISFMKKETYDKHYR